MTFRKSDVVRWAGSLLLLVLGAAAQGATVRGDTVRRAADIFQPEKIWTIKLSLSPEQWELMQPKPYPPGDTTPRRNGVASNLKLDEARADFEFDGEVFHDVGLRAKGNGTLLNAVSPRLPLKVDLNKNVKGQKLAGLSKLNLHANVWDPTGMNETLAYRLFREAGVAAPRVTYARVYLTVAGKYEAKYLGLYSVVENADDNFAEERFGGRDGVFFKPAEDNFFTYHGSDWAAYEQVWDPKDEPTAAQKQRVIDFVAFANFATDAEFAAHLGKLFDLDTFARQMAVAVWIANLDGPPAKGQNFYLYLDSKTGRFIPVPWDQDDAWGGIYQTQDMRNTVNIFQPWPTPQAFISRVYHLEAFRKTYLETLAKIALDLGRSEKLVQQQLDLAAVLRTAVQEDSVTALGLFDGAISGINVPRTFSGVFGAHGPHLTLREFVRARERSVIDQLLGAP